jgi:hypothetical protein
VRETLDRLARLPGCKPKLRPRPLAAACRKGRAVSAGCSHVNGFVDRVSVTSLVSKYGHYAGALNGMATPVPYRGRVGRVYGVSIVSSKLFPSILT